MADRPAPYLQEFEALDHIISRIPHKSHRGILTNDVEWTCIDVTKKYIVIGTNSSIVCLYYRLTGQVKKLNVKLKGVTITKVKLTNSTDYEIAVGTSTGHIYIYVLPSELPGRNKTLQVFTISDIHTAAVTCLEWNDNAMKLFSGDKTGRIVCTEFDYSESTSKSFLLCIESCEIVQLSYVARTLLISSTFRTVLYVGGKAENIIQVGTKDRKILGMFGATVMANGKHSKEPIIFACRPGLRLWQAGLNGKVTATYIFKDLVTELSKNVSLLSNTTMGLVPHSTDNCQFGLLFVYQDSFLLTYHGTELFVIDPVTRAFTSYHTNLGHISDVAICDDEVFILRNVTGRILLRLACKPEQRIEVPSHLPLNIDNSSISQSAVPRSEVSPVQVLTGTASKMSQSIMGLVKEVGEKIQSVTEGHKANNTSRLPPWGAASGKGSLEHNVQSLGTNAGSPDGSVDSAHEASPSLLNSPAKSSPELNDTQLEVSKVEGFNMQSGNCCVHIQPSSVPKQKHSLPTSNPSPVIRLDGDQLFVLKVEYDALGKAQRTNSSNEEMNSPNTENTTYISGKADDTEEKLVYFQKTKKSRKKKIKPDAVSISSTDSADCNTTGSAACVQSSKSTSVISNQEMSSGSVTNPLDAPSQSKNTSQGENVSLGSSEQPESQGMQNRQCTFDIDLEKLKKDDNIDVFDMLSEKPMTESIASKFAASVREHDECLLELGTNHVNRENTDEHIRPDDVKIANKSPHNAQHPTSLGTVKLLSLDLNSPATTPNTESSQSISISAESMSPEMQDQSGSSLSRKSASEGEDFYSLYNAQPFSPSLPDNPQTAEQSIESAIDYSGSNGSVFSSAVSSENAPRQPVADSWVEFKAPANVCSMSLTNRHIWFVDRKQRLFYSSLSEPVLEWKALSGSANQIAVSPNGWIMWKLHNNMIHVATGVSAGNPSIKDWKVIAREVAYISVDDNMAWYIKLNGELGMHKKLSKDRPCHRCITVKCPHQVSQVCCHQGIVWALTTERNIIVRVGITADREEGTDWLFLQGEGPCQLVSSFSLDDNQTAWILDLVGRVWFTTGVSPDKPVGSGYWWQVSMSEYLMQDVKAFYLIKSLLDKPHNLSKLVTTDKGGLIRAGRQGVWLSPGHSNVFHACRGSIMGHRWDICIFNNLISSTKWLHVSASASVGGEGLIWALQSCGSFFCFPSNYKSGRIVEVQQPKASLTINTISASQEAFWVLMTNGDVFVRADIAPHCKQGIHWAQLSLAQIGDSRFIHLSCGSQTVWAVDDSGVVYMRIGVQAPGMGHLNPAWVVVDGCPKEAGSRFVKVFVGTNDSMVWALDSKHCVYVRRGVTEELPVGKYWYYVSGTGAATLCVSDHTVYALNLDGEVLVRYGISEENADGNYWKKIPGAFSALSVTADNELWAIDKDNHLYKRHVYYLRRQVSKEGSCSQETHPEEGWELL